MTKRLLSALTILCFFSCGDKKTSSYQTRDYVSVGRMMDTISPPYIINLVNKSKHLIFIGCDHNNDQKHPQYAIIQRYFSSLHPQITFNEGGQIADSIHFSTAQAAIIADGETGMLKYLSDKAKIKMMNGDTPDSAEFKIMLKKFPSDKLFLYYMMERLVIPYLNGAYGNPPFEKIYLKALNKWFIEKGFPLSGDQRTLRYFTTLYKKYTGLSFELKLNAGIELFDYINDNCEFCAIGRASKMTRDSILLCKLDTALNHHDRVMVTFGHGHALALEPALQQLINKH